MKAFLYRVCAIFFSHFVLYPDYRISFFIPLAFRFADYIPGDATPPSRFVRAAFYRGTAPQRATGFDTVQQCFHLLNNFDIPIGIEHSQGDIPDIPSATQWTSAIDLTNRKVYYKTAYNNSIRCIDLKAIDFSKVKYQSQPLDKIQEQPVEMVKIPR